MTEMQDPFLDAGMRGWIVNTAKKNFWRVAAWYELDDLVQDGYLCYAKVRNHQNYRFLTIKRHPSQGDRRHFMALVQSAFENHITTLATKRMGCPEEMPVSQMASVENDESLQSVMERLLPAETGTANLAVLLAKAPEELSVVVATLIADATEFLRYRRPGCRRLLRETNAQRCWRLLGDSPRLVNLMQEVRAYFVE